MCLLVFVAAIDTIPDPDAISPQSSHSSSGIFVGHVRGNPAPLRQERIVSASLPQREQMNWFSRGFALELLPTGHLPLPRVHHAADTSPPVLS